MKKKRKRKETEIESLAPALSGIDPTIQLSQHAASEMKNHSLFASLHLFLNSACSFLVSDSFHFVLAKMYFEGDLQRACQMKNLGSLLKQQFVASYPPFHHRNSSLHLPLPAAEQISNTVVGVCCHARY